MAYRPAVDASRSETSRRISFSVSLIRLDKGVDVCTLGSYQSGRRNRPLPNWDARGDPKDLRLTSDWLREGRAGEVRVRVVRSAWASLAGLGRGLVDLDVGEFHAAQVVVCRGRVVGRRRSSGKVISRHRVENAALLGHVRDWAAVAIGDDALIVGRVVGCGLGRNQIHKSSDGDADGPAVAQKVKSGVAR